MSKKKQTSWNQRSRLVPKSRATGTTTPSTHRRRDRLHNHVLSARLQGNPCGLAIRTGLEAALKHTIGNGLETRVDVHLLGTGSLLLARRGVRVDTLGCEGGTNEKSR